MAYYVGDIPAEDVVVEPQRGGEDVLLEPFDTVIAELYDPSGTEVDSAGFLGSIDGAVILVEWPSDSVLGAAGLYELRIILENSVTSVRERLAPTYLVVQADDGWHTIDSSRAQWVDAPLDDRALHEVLSVAKEAVLAFAPAVDPEERPPTNYVRAQLLQARNTWNASKVDPSGQLGDGTFATRPFPLDWQIKQLLRPRTILPAVG